VDLVDPVQVDQEGLIHLETIPVQDISPSGSVDQWDQWDHTKDVEAIADALQNIPGTKQKKDRRTPRNQ
jgi:hypothetical protein